ncbi:MAG: nucleoside phosphorylase [bacterium]|nr:nucleoside phosphorylase [bacterium]
MAKASKPKAKDGKGEYHTGLKKRDLAPRCLLVGSPARAVMIAETFFEGAKQVGDDHRGYKCFTGKHRGMDISVVTTQIGCPSTGIVLPESVRSGAKVFIRVGSCGTLQRMPRVGHVAICTGAVRLDGATKNWAPIEYPAIADYRIVAALVAAAKELRLPHHVGVGATTDCFVEGQARPGYKNYIPPWLKEQFKWLQHLKVLFYSMEESGIFVWCASHGGFPAGAIDAIFANRVTEDWGEEGQKEAAQIAIEAFHRLDELL